MSLSITININQADLKRVKMKLKALRNFSKDELKKSLTHFAAQTTGRVKRRAPVDTGRLRREVTGKVSNGNMANFTSIAIDPETREDYAPIQEHEQPYFFSTIRMGTRKLVEDLTRKLKLIGQQR